MPDQSHRPRLPAVSEEMKAWSAALASDVGSWPQVSTRAFFGFTALYREGRIFALLPRTRGMETANALAFRIAAPGVKLRARIEKDPRIRSAERKKAQWFSFELSSDSDLHNALDWLSQAYESVTKK
jgi:hypothetical protein